jgi:hypothetical protein
MATWADVDELAGRLPGAERAMRPERAPAWYAGRHTFARLRVDAEGRELVQVWSGEMDTEQALAGRRDTFRYRVTSWARLDRLDRRELAELLLESYDIRGGRRRRGTTDLSDLLATR